MSVIMIRIRDQFLPSQATLIAGGLGDTMIVYAYLSMILGLIFASPVILYEIYAFVRPALYPNERKILHWYGASALGLLLLGGAMAYFLIIPLMFRILIFFTMSGGAVPLVFIKDFYTWVLMLFAVCVVFYVVPIVVVLLAQVGILPMKYLRGKNKFYIYLFAWLFLWLTPVTPDNTPITGTIMLIPWIAVFEGLLFASKHVFKTNQQEIVTVPGARNVSRWARLFPERPKCRYCNSTLKTEHFCDRCGKSQS